MSSPRAPGQLKQLWCRWKALRLPWRKRFLVGADLSGNTFWEFKDALNSNRFRRIVQYRRRTHYGDVEISRMSPWNDVEWDGMAWDSGCMLMEEQHNGTSGSDTQGQTPRAYRNSSTISRAKQ
jgi:hypothetical protein